jgi:TonB family protein
MTSGHNERMLRTWISKRLRKPVAPAEDSQVTGSSSTSSLSDIPTSVSTASGFFHESHSGSGMHLGDLFEIAIPVVLIAAALYIGHGRNSSPAVLMPLAPSLNDSGAASSTPAPVTASGQSAPVHSSREAAAPVADSRPVSTRPIKPAKQAVLSVDVDENGAPQNVTVLESAGVDLDAKAVAEVRTWTFAPATFKGRRVRSRVNVHYP